MTPAPPIPTDGRPRRVRDAASATAAYVVLTLVLTWPLVRGLTHDVPSDLGDPILNAWILSWDADHLLRAAAGHVSALAGYWQANIYYPHPYALAYSEHLTAEALVAAPVYAATRNPILSYNVVFLSTFVLSGLGMFLFARELTGNRRAAFVAGLAFAFAPYRFGSLPHVQVLSSEWMPFALFGLCRFFEHRRPAALAGAGAAWLAQNLSCSYYLIFFSPVVVLYALWEIARRHLWRDWRVIVQLAAVTGLVVAATIPFVVPYMRLRAGGFLPRSIEETRRFSADAYSYLTTEPILLVWGNVVRAWPKVEGGLFPGLTIAALALVAIALTWRDARRRSDVADSIGRRRVAAVLAIGLAASAAISIAVLFGWSLRLPMFRITSFSRALLIACALAGVLFVVSTTTRATARQWASEPAAILAATLLFAIAMSFGPDIRARGRIVADTNLYAWFYNNVPGFDGLRVPARFGMVVAFALAALTAIGVAAIDARRRDKQRTPGRAWAAILSALIVLESIAVPLPINGNDTDYKQAGLVALPDYVLVGDRTPAVYRLVAQLPPGSAVLELPFGEVAFEARYVFYSTAHWRPIVNGYSGGAPVGYGLLAEALRDVPRDGDRAWSALRASEATHVVLHGQSYEPARGAAVDRWLRQHGCREIASHEREVVFALQ